MLIPLRCGSFSERPAIALFGYLALSVLVFFVKKPNMMGPPPDAH